MIPAMTADRINLRSPSTRLGLGVLAALIAAAASGEAAAQPIEASLRSPFAADGAIRPQAGPSEAHARFVLPYHPSEGPAIPEGTVRTSVDRDLSARGLSGSVGYLCGLGPSPNETNGPVTSYERVGTFLGAQLRQSF
jgi:hypothetical protein